MRLGCTPYNLLAHQGHGNRRGLNALRYNFVAYDRVPSGLGTFFVFGLGTGTTDVTEARLSSHAIELFANIIALSLRYMFKLEN